MGHDITPFSRHNLKVENIETLAHDLFDRLDFNIKYGYFCFAEPDSLFTGIKNREGKEVILGQLIKNKKARTLSLWDENYQQQQLINAFGKEVILRPEYWLDYTPLPENSISNERLEREYNSLQLNDYKLFSLKELESWFYIYDEIFSNSYVYYSRWWTFCRQFLCGYMIDDDSFNAYRHNAFYFSRKFGGDVIYYLDDQSKVFGGVGQGDEMEMTWMEFENFIQEKAGDLLLDIPKYFLEESYQQIFTKGNKDPFRAINNEKYPLAFVDDFKDTNFDLESWVDKPS